MSLVRTILAFAGAVIGLSATSPILLVALFYRAVTVLTKRLAPRLEPSFASWDQVIEFHPVIGWKPKGNLDVYAMGSDDLFHMTTDGEGWRGQMGLEKSEVVVFGDSHGFGEGIDDAGYFATVCQGLKVKAIAANGYNTVQELLWMKELAPRLRNKLVVWLVFLGNDLLDNLEASMMHYRTPFVRRSAGRGGWELVTSHVNASPWPIISRRYRQENYDRLTKAFTPGFLADRAFGALDYLLAEGAAVCQQAGARLVVLSIPDPKMLNPEGLNLLFRHGADPKTLDPDLPDRQLAAICSKLQLPFIAGKSEFGSADFKERDDHWNRTGHSRMARLLERVYQQFGPRLSGERTPSASAASAPSASASPVGKLRTAFETPAQS